MIRLYNVLRKFRYLPTTKETKLLETPEPEEVVEETVENAGLNKALDTYRKLIEKKGGKDAIPLTTEQQERLEKRISEIEDREVIEEVVEHVWVQEHCSCL
jgi:DNA-directed RNA polymerase I, II, and III subunit RPABC2